MKCIFSIASEENFKKVMLVFLSEKHSSNAGSDSSNAEAASDVCNVVRRNLNYALERPTLRHRRVRYSHCSSRVSSVNSLDAEGASDDPSSDASDGPTSLQTSLTSVLCVDAPSDA